MLSRRTELVGHVLAEDMSLYGGGFGLQRVLDEPRIRMLVLAERDDLFHAHATRSLSETLVLCDVAIDYGRATGFNTGENLRLGVRDGVKRAEEFQMHGRNGGDDGNLRAHQLRQRRDLARMIHADLEH